MAPNILLVDDDTELVRSLRLVLTQDGYEVLTAHNGLEGLQTAHQMQPDLIVLDVNMPWMDGLEVCRRLRLDADSALRFVPILFLTSQDSVDDHVTGLDAGADDYLDKPFQSKELKARVRALLRRREAATALPAADTPELTVGPLTLHLQACWVRRGSGEAVQLTPAEFELLYHLMTHPKRPFSSENLLEEVWAYAPGTADPSLVRWHIKNLRLKIEPNASQPSLIRTVSRRGYMLVPEG
ncbi:MAG: response regulator transcription factor [Chloroflexi bacterium]|nr:response regulator transcription factor [Chloroflexota bacterium]MBP7591926.1 response regulator transcription factor [Chloroflexota bacterium]